MVRGEIEIELFFKKDYNVKQVQNIIKSLAINLITFSQLKEEINSAISIISSASLLLSNHYKDFKFKYGQVFRLIEIIRNSVEGTLKLFERAKAQHGDVIVALQYNISYHPELIQYSKNILDYIPPYDKYIGQVSNGPIDIADKLPIINSPGLNGQLLKSDNTIYIIIDNTEMTKIRNVISPYDKNTVPTMQKYQWIKVVSKNEMEANNFVITQKNDYLVLNNKHKYTGINFTGMEYNVDKYSSLLYYEYLLVRMDFIQSVRTSLGLTTDLADKYILGVYCKLLKPIEFMRKMNIWDLTRNNCQCISLIKIAKLLYNK